VCRAYSASGTVWTIVHIFTVFIIVTDGDCSGSRRRGIFGKTTWEKDTTSQLLISESYS
jgi:hypothetical protein